MIIRNPERDKYVKIAKASIEDDRLSFKAKGLLTYLMSKPDNWVVMVSQLVKVGKDSRVSVMSALKELEDAGYVVRGERSRRDDGTWDLPSTEVYETPRSQPVSETDSGETPRSQPVSVIRGGSSAVDNRHLVTTEEATTEEVLSPEPAEAPPSTSPNDVETDGEAAIARMWGLTDPSAILPAQRREISDAARQLRGHTASDIFERGQRIMRLRDWNHLTPHALTTNWHLVGASDEVSVSDQVDLSAQRRREEDAIRAQAEWVSDHPGEPVPLASEFLEAVSA